LKNLFNNLNEIDYYFDNKKYVIRDIFDINKRSEMIDKYLNNIEYYIIHEIKDGDKWEYIAKKYYGNSNMKMFWIFIIMNEIEDPFFDFALTVDELGKATRYTEENSQISFDLFENAINQNDEKRFIKILKKEYIKNFENDFFKEIV
jgi:hypothetical protein